MNELKNQLKGSPNSWGKIKFKKGKTEHWNWIKFSKQKFSKQKLSQAYDKLAV